MVLYPTLYLALFLLSGAGGFSVAFAVTSREMGEVLETYRMHDLIDRPIRALEQAMRLAQTATYNPVARRLVTEFAEISFKA